MIRSPKCIRRLETPSHDYALRTSRTYKDLEVGLRNPSRCPNEPTPWSIWIAVSKLLKTSAHRCVELSRLRKPPDAGQRNLEHSVRVLVWPRPLFGRDFTIRCAFDRGRRNNAESCRIEAAGVTALKPLAVSCSPWHAPEAARKPPLKKLHGLEARLTGYRQEVVAARRLERLHFEWWRRLNRGWLWRLYRGRRRWVNRSSSATLKQRYDFV